MPKDLCEFYDIVVSGIYPDSIEEDLNERPYPFHRPSLCNEEIKYWVKDKSLNPCCQ